MHKRPGPQPLAEELRRNQPVTAVMTTAEADTIRRVAAAHDMTVSTYLRKIVLAAITTDQMASA